MHYENLHRSSVREPWRDTVTSICPTGILHTQVIVPSVVSRTLSPLLALHGIARDAAELSQAFADAAEKTGRIVVVPHFPAATWPVFQRITRRARPDRALLALFGTLRAMDSVFDGPYDIFGFSGGAQLGHRFAMLYPEVVGDLHLGAAGWYTLPDESTAYPYGLLPRDDRDATWCRLMRDGLNRFLQRRFDIYVGSDDIERDDTLRKNDVLDQQQGPNRKARACSYVAALNKRQADLDMESTARLQVLDDCGHRFADCAAWGDLAYRVCSAS